jgi:membrane protein
MSHSDRLERELHALSSRRPRLYRAIMAVIGLFRRAYHDEITDTAGTMAFDLFLGLVPLVALLGFLAGILADSGAAVDLDTRLLDLAPGPAAELAHAQYLRLAHASSALAPLSLIGFVWISSGAAHSAMFRTRRILGLDDRGYFYTRFLAILFTLGAFVLTVASSIAIVTIHRLGALSVFSIDVARSLDSLVGVTTIGATLLGVSALYRLAAGHSGRDRRVLPGAIVAVILFGFVSWAFSGYVAHIARYAAFYGGLAAVAMMLFWLYLTSLALMFGAEVNLLVSPGARASRHDLDEAHVP